MSERTLRNEDGGAVTSSVAQSSAELRLRETLERGNGAQPLRKGLTEQVADARTTIAKRVTAKRAIYSAIERDKVRDRM